MRRFWRWIGRWTGWPVSSPPGRCRLAAEQADAVARRTLFSGRRVDHMSSLRGIDRAGLRANHRQCAVDSGRSGIGERCSRLFQRFICWLAALDGHDDSASIFSEVPRATLTADQTGSFILTRRSFWMRFTAALCLAVAAVGFALLLHGIDAAERRRDAMLRAVPAGLPSMERHAPPINSGGCLVSNGLGGIVTRYK